MLDSTRQSFAYPLRFAANGGLELATGDEVTQDRIRSILETRPREMIMRPNYGLSDQAFTAIPSPDVIAERIRQAIEIQLQGEVSVFITSTLTEESGQLHLQIDWQKTGSTRGVSEFNTSGAGAGRISYAIAL